MCPRCKKSTYKISLSEGLLRCTNCGLTDVGHFRAMKGWKTRRKSSKRAPIASRTHGKRLLGSVLVSWFLAVILAIPVFAFEGETMTYVRAQEDLEKVRVILQEILVDMKKEEPSKQLGIVHAGKVTAYNSVPEQTDDTPFETASGKRTRDGIVANNCLPFGTKVVIEGKTYEVEDRMNKRYGCEHYDIWMEEVPDARKFGMKRLDVVELID